MVLPTLELEAEQLEPRRTIGSVLRETQEVQESEPQKQYCFATQLTEKSSETMDPFLPTGKSQKLHDLSKIDLYKNTSYFLYHHYKFTLEIKVIPYLL